MLSEAVFLCLLLSTPCAVAIKLLVDAKLHDKIYDERVVYEAKQGNVIRNKVERAYKIRNYRGSSGHHDSRDFFILSVIIIMQHRYQVLNISDGIADKRYF